MVGIIGFAGVARAGMGGNPASPYLMNAGMTGGTFDPASMANVFMMFALFAVIATVIVKLVTFAVKKGAEYGEIKNTAQYHEAALRRRFEEEESSKLRKFGQVLLEEYRNYVSGEGLSILERDNRLTSENILSQYKAKLSEFEKAVERDRRQRAAEEKKKNK